MTPPPTNDTTTLPLTIRFSASLPDLLLDVHSPSITTAAGLKQLIRTNLPNDLSARRLRLIYAGRGLDDTAPLPVSLKLPQQRQVYPYPYLFPATGGLNNAGLEEEEGEGDKGERRDKGKAPIRGDFQQQEEQQQEEEQQRRQRQRIYVHCSIGDIILSEAELTHEAAITTTISIQRQRKQREEERRKRLFASGVDVHAQEAQEEEEQQQYQQQQEQREQTSSSTTTPAPRGFDRLLPTGFTAAEVAGLRSQFLAILSTSRTPDTMPTGLELRELEDRWLDEGSAAGGGGGGGTGGMGNGGDVGNDDGEFGAGVVDDMLWGAVMGFFWPVGCIMWLRREEGVWSWRKGLAVIVGVIVNAGFGAVKIMG